MGAKSFVKGYCFMRYNVTFDSPKLSIVLDRDSDQAIETAAWDAVKTRTLGELLVGGQTLSATVSRAGELVVPAAKLTFELARDNADDAE